MENTKTPESEREGNTSIQPDSVKKLENLFEKVRSAQSSIEEECSLQRQLMQEMKSELDALTCSPLYQNSGTIKKLSFSSEEDSSSSMSSVADMRDKTIARLKDHLSRELLYRQALEKQLAQSHIRKTVDEAEEKYRLVKDQELKKLKGRIAELEDALEHGNSNNNVSSNNDTSLVAAVNAKSIVNESDVAQFAAMEEIRVLQSDLEERARETIELKKKLAEAEEARDLAYQSSMAMKTGISHLENERKALRAQIMKLKMGNVPLNVRNAKTELLGYQEKVAELTKKVEELQKELISQTSLRDRMVSSLENELRRERESRSSLRMRLLKSPQEDSFDEGEAKVDFRLYRATVNDLSDALLFKILFNLGSVELILSTQYVCRRWQKIAWRIFTQQVRKLRRNGMQARGILDKLRDMFKK